MSWVWLVWTIVALEVLGALCFLLGVWDLKRREDAACRCIRKPDKIPWSVRYRSWISSKPIVVFEYPEYTSAEQNEGKVFDGPCWTSKIREPETPCVGVQDTTREKLVQRIIRHGQRNGIIPWFECAWHRSRCPAREGCCGESEDCSFADAMESPSAAGV